MSASGKIQPQRLVNISADTMGRVTDLAVEEGQSVQKGQFLLQIDPRNLTTAYNQGAASLAAARSQMEQLRVSIDGTKTSLKQAQEALTRQQQLYKQGLTPKEQLDNAENLVRMRQSELSSAERQIETQRLRMTQEEASLENAKLNLSKVRIESPITGIITRRNIEEGETVVIGTMNNAGTQPPHHRRHVAHRGAGRGGRDRHPERDARPEGQDHDRRDAGQDASRARSSRSATARSTATGSAASQATNFLVKVAVEGVIPDVRPGFTCTAEITTATRGRASSRCRSRRRRCARRSSTRKATSSPTRIRPRPSGARRPCWTPS